MNQEIPDLPPYTIDNITGNTPALGPTVDSSASSVNVRSSDNTAMGNVTITATESVRSQLAALPEQLRNQLMQQMAMQKLQESAMQQQRLQEGALHQPNTSTAFVDTFGAGNPQYVPQQTTSGAGNSQYAPQQQTASGGPIIGDVSMQQAANQSDITQPAVDLNMVQTYLGDQGPNVSFDSFGSLTGGMNIDCDTNVAANVNVSSTGNQQYQMNEVDAAIQSLTQSWGCWHFNHCT